MERGIVVKQKPQSRRLDVTNLKNKLAEYHVHKKGSILAVLLLIVRTSIIALMDFVRLTTPL